MSVWFSKAEGPCQVRRGHCPTAPLPSLPSSQHQHQIPAQSFTLGYNLSLESLEKTKKIPTTLSLRNVNNSKSGLIFHSACFAGLFAHHVSFFSSLPSLHFLSFLLASTLFSLRWLLCTFEAEPPGSFNADVNVFGSYMSRNGKEGGGGGGGGAGGGGGRFFGTKQINYNFFIERKNNSLHWKL